MWNSAFCFIRIYYIAHRWNMIHLFYWTHCEWYIYLLFVTMSKVKLSSLFMPYFSILMKLFHAQWIECKKKITFICIQQRKLFEMRRYLLSFIFFFDCNYSEIIIFSCAMCHKMASFALEQYDSEKNLRWCFGIPIHENVCCSYNRSTIKRIFRKWCTALFLPISILCLCMCAFIILYVEWSLSSCSTYFSKHKILDSMIL